MNQISLEPSSNPRKRNRNRSKNENTHADPRSLRRKQRKRTISRPIELARQRKQRCPRTICGKTLCRRPNKLCRNCGSSKIGLDQRRGLKRRLEGLPRKNDRDRIELDEQM